MPSARDERLARIYERGDAIRARRHRMVLGAATSLVLVGGLVAVALPHDRDDLVVADGPPITETSTTTSTTLAAPITAAPTTTEPAPTTTTTAVPTTVSSSPPTTTVSRTTPTTTVATTTAPKGPPPTTADGHECRNSTDPACGEFYFDPEPVNEPMTVSLNGPVRLAAGTTARFVARAREPDGRVSENCATVHFGDGTATPWRCAMAGCVQPTRHGPWDPPVPSGGTEAELVADHTFENPGTYEVRARFTSGTGCDTVYSGEGEVTLTVVVE